MTIKNYIDNLSSPSPTPGGGSASALSAILGLSLCSMVLNITKKKIKYQKNKEQYDLLLNEIEKGINELFILQKKDEDVFNELKEVYNTDKEEAALLKAASIPKEVLEISNKFIKELMNLFEITPKLLISDLGIAVLHLSAAAQSSYLTILINTNYLKDREAALKINEESLTILNNLKDNANLLTEKIEKSLIK